MSPPKTDTGQPSDPANLIYQSVLPVKSTDDILEASKTTECVSGVASSLQFEREIYASQNRLWSAGFEPLPRSISTTNDDFLSARILKLRSLTLMIDLAGSLSSTELVYDSYFPNLRALSPWRNHSCRIHAPPKPLQNARSVSLQDLSTTYNWLRTNVETAAFPTKPSCCWNRSRGERAHGPTRDRDGGHVVHRS